MGSTGNNGTDAGSGNRADSTPNPVAPVKVSDPYHSRKPEDLHPEILRRWDLIKAMWTQKHPDGPRIFLVCTFRPPESQAILFRREQTRADAWQSLHNYMPALALDFGFQKDGKYLAGREHLHMYREAGEYAEQCGLEWGGRWKPPDHCHIQAAKFTWQQAQYGIEPDWPEIKT